MRIRTALICSSAASLAACTNGLADFRPTMGADPSEIGYEAQALINEMRLAYDETDAACMAISPSVQNVEKESYRRLRAGGKTPAKVNCVKYKTADSAPITPQRYFEAGLALSDLYCDDYFRRMSEHKQKRQFARSTTNDIGTAASAGLGLASAGSIITGGVGAAFGLADNLFRNYDAAFVVEPNLGKVMKLVKTAQTTYRGTVQAGSLTNFYDAHRAINEYAQKCSYTGMDALLDRAIEEGTQAASIEDSMASFQTAKERADLRIQQEKARIAEESLAAVKREKEAKEKAAAERSAIDATNPSARPPGS